MKEYEIFLPLYYNDGTPIDTTFIPALRVRLLEQFNGVTPVVEFASIRAKKLHQHANAVFGLK